MVAGKWLSASQKMPAGAFVLVLLGLCRRSAGFFDCCGFM